MIATGSGLVAGGVGIGTIPYNPSHIVSYRPIVRRNTSPFQNTATKPVDKQAVERVARMPKPKTPKPRVPRAPRQPNPNARKHVPYYEQERIVAARAYMATPKECIQCHNPFSAREGERIDGYRRRETCDRTCAARRARLRREGKLDD